MHRQVGVCLVKWRRTYVYRTSAKRFFVQELIPVFKTQYARFAAYYFAIDVVVFPHMIVPLLVVDERIIKGINHSVEESKFVLLLSSKNYLVIANVAEDEIADNKYLQNKHSSGQLNYFNY